MQVETRPSHIMVLKRSQMPPDTPESYKRVVDLLLRMMAGREVTVPTCSTAIAGYKRRLSATRQGVAIGRDTPEDSSSVF